MLYTFLFTAISLAYLNSCAIAQSVNFAGLTGKLWGLDSLDGVRDNIITRPKNINGTGVTIIFLDHSINSAHENFHGRNVLHVDCCGDTCQEGQFTGSGIATHSAGIAAGKYTGIAQNANIVSIKILDYNCKKISETFPKSLNWILTNRNNPQKMSNKIVVYLGVLFDKSEENANQLSAWNALITKIQAAGAVVIGGLSKYIPDEKKFLFSGTINVGGYAIDNRPLPESSLTADIYAPGSDIYSSDPANPKGYVKSQGLGSAMAHVVGVSALLLSRYTGTINNNTPGFIKSQLFLLSKKDGLNFGIGDYKRLSYQHIERLDLVPEVKTSFRCLDRYPGAVFRKRNDNYLYYYANPEVAAQYDRNWFSAPSYFCDKFDSKFLGVISVYDKNN